MSEVIKESIGCKLKRRREELGYSLKDAAERTRIRKSHIENLEENRFSHLPGGAYVTGFVKVYAIYLGMDPAPLLAQLDETTPESTSHPQKPQLSKDTAITANPGTGWAAFFVGFVIMLILGGGLYFLLAEDDMATPRGVAPVVEQKNLDQETTHVLPSEEKDSVDQRDENAVIETQSSAADDVNDLPSKDAAH